jgi:protein-tyrosine phosphatase
MAERLLVLAARQRLGKLDAAADVGDLLRSTSAGTGGWHEGEEMNPPAARQILLRGGSVDGFAARKLRTAHLAEADLIVTATGDQLDYVHALLPDAAGRTFVLRHLSRLLPTLDAGTLPPAGTDPEGFASRAADLVAAADRARGDVPALPEDDLDDPWGRGDQTFARIADDIDEAMYALVDALLPAARQRAG